MSSLRNPPISHTVLHHSEIELEWICGLVKEQELEVWAEGCTERPFAPCTRGSLHRKALPPNTNYYSLLQWRCEWPFSYSGKSRDETGLSYFSPGCEQRLWSQRIQRCSHPCISSWDCPRWSPHWSCWAAPCHPPRCVWHCGSASGTGSAPGSPATKHTHNAQLLAHSKGHNVTVWTNWEPDIKVTGTHWQWVN